MSTKVKFQRIIDTLANIAAKKFAGRGAWATDLSRWIFYYNGTNYSVFARNDVRETFAGGIKIKDTIQDTNGAQILSSLGAYTGPSLQATNVAGTGTRPLVADTSGNIDDQDAATFRATIAAQGSATVQNGTAGVIRLPDTGGTSGLWCKLADISFPNGYNYLSGVFLIAGEYNGSGSSLVQWRMTTATGGGFTFAGIKMLGNHTLDPSLFKVVVTSSYPSANTAEIWFQSPSGYSIYAVRHLVADGNGTWTPVTSPSWVASPSAGTSYGCTFPLLATSLQATSHTSGKVPRASTGGLFVNGSLSDDGSLVSANVNFRLKAALQDTNGAQILSSLGAYTGPSLQATNLAGPGARPLISDASGNIISGNGSGAAITVVQSSAQIPPGSPVIGVPYLVSTGATGAWSGQDEKLATWNGSAWSFATRAPRSVCYSLTTSSPVNASFANGAECFSAESIWATGLVYANAGFQASNLAGGGAGLYLPVARDNSGNVVARTAAQFRADIGAASSANADVCLASPVATNPTLTTTEQELLGIGSTQLINPDGTGCVDIDLSLLASSAGTISWSVYLGSTQICNAATSTDRVRFRVRLAYRATGTTVYSMSIMDGTTADNIINWGTADMRSPLSLSVKASIVSGTRNTSIVSGTITKRVPG